MPSQPLHRPGDDGPRSPWPPPSITDHDANPLDEAGPAPFLGCLIFISMIVAAGLLAAVVLAGSIAVVRWVLE
jgi:hypothetical protein